MDGAAPAPRHVMRLPQNKPTIPLPETLRPQPDPEKAIGSWEGEGGKVAPAEDPSVEPAHSRAAEEGRLRSA